MSAWSQAPAIKSVEASAFTIPAEQPERDGTLEWSQTTLLLVVARAGDSTGIGYSYAHPAAAEVVNAKLAEIVCGQDPLQVGRAWAGMWRAVRNFGQTGLVSMAISAVDVALWDLKARLLGRALVDVIDAVRDTTPVYGSGDVTRCGGISGFLRAAALCDARSMDLSAHCAPQLSAHACAAVWHLRHLEYFHDHNRIEHLAFDGCLEPETGGVLRPDRTRPGLGLEVRWPDLEQWRAR